MGLHIHRAERTDLLADGLGALLADPLPDPFAEELVLVPARGVERWLSQRLSHVLGRGPAGRDGVCAGVAFRSPGSLIAEITGASDDDPWSPDALTWPLLEAIDRSLDEPWCATLATHLGHFDTGPEADLRRGRRYSVARRLAGLFASYAGQRPQLLADWLDGRPGDLDVDLAWQPELWRAVAALVPADPPHIRHRTTVARLREGPIDLPARLSLFGHTRLTVTDVELLDAVATHHDLHLWLPHPSDELWRALGDLHGAVPRHADDSRATARHPLLDTLGRDLRELQRALPATRASDDYLGSRDGAPDTLLSWLQADIAANAVRSTGRELAADDRSVQVHSCHGPARQVDVLREVLLGLLQDDPTLEPRDIVVMCPDVEMYAPLIIAAFGLGDLPGEGHPAHRLRVRIADRAPAQTNPLLAVAEKLLGIAGGRVPASEVLGLAQAAPVRARFRFDDEELDEITAWVGESGIRWGFDTEGREQYGLGDILHNTWRFGLDRILTGVAMSDDSRAWLGTALPLDDVGSDAVELTGRFAEYVERLRAAVGALSGPRPLADWIAALDDGIAALTWVSGDDAWQLGQLRREFEKVLTQSGSHSTTPLRLPDVRALLAGQLAGRPTRANFRTGALTVCTMVPMRAVPHRVVCLVGLDDGVFPRPDRADGDDVLARAPMTGERDVRSEERQLLLDAICAATDTLVITYTGADEHTGRPHPPAVPLAEVLDALDRTTSGPIRDRVVMRHPLQLFDIRNVTPGAMVPGHAFTFDPTALVAAEAAAGERRPPRPFFADPLPESGHGEVALEDLLTFVSDPVRGFLRALDYSPPREVPDISDEIPVSIDALERWAAGDRMLADILRGESPEAAAGTEWRRGTLPPGRLGWGTAGEIRDCAAELARTARQHRQVGPTPYDVAIDLGAGRRLIGTVNPVFGRQLVSVTYSRLGAKELMRAWIPLLALAAAMPDENWSARCIGRGEKPQSGEPERIVQRHLGPPAAPVDTLRAMVHLYDAGRREPLPLPLKTSFAWAQARHRDSDPVKAADSTWNGRRGNGGDNTGHAQEVIWGPAAPLDVLLGAPRPGEEIGGESTRLGALAARLWLPLLRAEVR